MARLGIDLGHCLCLCLCLGLGLGLCSSACGTPPSPTAPTAASACDAPYFRHALVSPSYARVGPHTGEVHVVASDAATADLAIAVANTIVIARVPLARLEPAVVLESPVFAAPGAPAPLPIAVEPGFPLPAAGTYRDGAWLHVHHDTGVAFDGWISASARGTIWQPGLAVPPLLHADLLDFDARVDHDDALPVIAHVDDSAATDATHVGDWLHVRSRTAFVRLDAWAHLPVAPPRQRHTFDFQDDTIEADDVRFDHLFDLPRDSCLYAAPDTRAAVVGITTSAVAADPAPGTIGWLRLDLDAPWGRVIAYARDDAR
nr:hypothetical protein [Kofleriaceae bacterium]